MILCAGQLLMRCSHKGSRKLTMNHMCYGLSAPTRPKCTKHLSLCPLQRLRKSLTPRGQLSLEVMGEEQLRAAGVHQFCLGCLVVLCACCL